MAHKTAKTAGPILVAILLLGLLACIKTGTAAVNAAEINGHKSFAANSRYELYVNEDTLSLIVKDKQSGAYMESYTSYDDGNANKTWWGAMNSAVVLTMISGNDDTKQANTFNDNIQKKNFKKTQNGFTVDLYWNTFKLGLSLEVELTADGLTVRVPDESIREDGDKYQIGTIALYPYMGTSYKDQKAGYMLIPDGNGALIYLDDKEGRYNAGYSAVIYGSDIGFEDSSVEKLLWEKYEIVNDAERIIAPYFGIAHTDDRIAYLAIVEDGAMRATIDCMPNGVSIDYNRAYAKFVERKLYTQPTSNNSTAGSLHLAEAQRSHSDLQVRYIFLSDEDASYAGMANAYREYLVSNGLIKSVDTAYKTRIDFLGSDREEWVIGTTPVIMSTVEDIKEIYSDLETRGVSDILSVYKGWQKGGICRVPVTSYKVERRLGSKKELTGLINDSAAKGIQLYLYDDALRINPDEFNVTFNVVKRINKRKYSEETHKDVYGTYNWITPAKSITNVSKLAQKLNAAGVENLCLAGITSQLFSYTYSNVKYTRFDCGRSYAELIAKADDNTNLILEQPNAYLWSGMDAFLDMPAYTSSYIIEDEFVPFLSIALKGVVPVYSEYVNFEANKQEFFLKLVETGSFPSFYITGESSAELIYTNSSDIYSSEYSAYSDQIEQYSKELSELAKATAGATISNHMLLEDNLRRIDYSNGVKVYVNYGDSTAFADGLSIGARSYYVAR